MELIRNNYGENNGMLRFTYYVRPECEAKKFRDTNAEMFDKGRLIVFTNDFFTIYQDTNTGEMNISLNEIGLFMKYLYICVFGTPPFYYLNISCKKKI